MDCEAGILMQMMEAAVISPSSHLCFHAAWAMGNKSLLVAGTLSCGVVWCVVLLLPFVAMC
jgi:hypothetical protein